MILDNNTKTIKIGVIGAGTIGKEIVKQARDKGWEVVFIAEVTEVQDGNGQKIADTLTKEIARQAQVIFLAIPSNNDGTLALHFITLAAQSGVPIVTCEKAALSNHFLELKPFLKNIGYSATVGGGTHMLSFLRQHLSEKTTKIQASVNGTLQFICSEVSKGRTIEAVAAEAIEKRYAEPGATNAQDVITAELFGDVRKKVAIISNILGLSEKVLSYADITLPFSVEEVINELSGKRFVATWEKIDNQWTQRIQLLSIDDASPFNVTGTDNVAVIDNGAAGIYTLTGPGAGAEPTATAMTHDAVELLNK